MATEINTQQNGEIWLPADFFYGDFFVDGHEQSGKSGAVETPPDFDDENVAALARRMAISSLRDEEEEDDDGSFSNFATDKAKTRSWSESLPECPVKSKNRNPSEGTFSPSSPLERQNFDDDDGNNKRYWSYGNRNNNVNYLEIGEYESKKCPSDYRKQLKIRSRALSPLEWPPLAKNAVSLSMELKKESSGTGVFLPRPGPAVVKETKKKAGGSTVFVPARVAQALKLNLEQFGDLPRVSGGYVFDHDTLAGRSNTVLSQRRNNSSRLQ